MAAYEIEQFEMPNLRALNFYIHDVLGEGVSSNHRIDKQAKSLGEYLRAKLIDVPVFLHHSNPAELVPPSVQLPIQNVDDFPGSGC